MCIELLNYFSLIHNLQLKFQHINNQHQLKNILQHQLREYRELPKYFSRLHKLFYWQPHQHPSEYKYNQLLRPNIIHQLFLRIGNQLSRLYKRLNQLGPTFLGKFQQNRLYRHQRVIDNQKEQLLRHSELRNRFFLLLHQHLLQCKYKHYLCQHKVQHLIQINKLI